MKYRLFPELVMANAALMGVVVFISVPARNAPLFMWTFTGTMLLAVVVVRFLSERKVIHAVKRAPANLRMGGRVFGFDDPAIVLQVRRILEDRPHLLRGLPRWIYIGSYPVEAENHRGEFAGVINTDLVEPDELEACISEIRRGPLWWLDFTSVTGISLRVLLSALAVTFGASTLFLAFFLLFASALFGLVDSVNLRYLPL